ncbi:hypothetical protein [Halorubrum sp. SD626R]|jgi:hypothetical protein|uniref:hypothetical protein n=1 Tax=Halorubrum sp. SD626R TaxID=1419722 RepID=UPI0010F5F20A|nr:hypothetical protein [Halorubrum sp. SD626R]TKX81293.1 hypothetical protein EXE53_06165 [Halorubrum sp. SD626R]
MTAESVSRWWYGIAITILFGVLLYAFAFVFILLGPSEPANSDAELVIKVLSLAATAAAGLLLYVMTALYIISFIIDWWCVFRTDLTEYKPTRWYLLIPLAALSNFIVPVIATPVLVAGGLYYLWQRSRMIGRPDLHNYSQTPVWV